MRLVGRALPLETRNRLRRQLERSQDWVKRRRVGVLSEQDQCDALVEAGVHDGAVVMLHVAMSRIHRWVPDTSPRRLIDMILGLLGSRGTVLVPTFPFTGSQSTYAHRNPVFDVQRTPSALGVLTEVFRVMPGVVRSRHPTHPVAGIGSGAHALLGDHERSSTFGPGSPFHRLVEIDALVIGIGVAYANAFTVFHTAEALHPCARSTRLRTRRSASTWLTVRSGSAWRCVPCVPACRTTSAAGRHSR